MKRCLLSLAACMVLLSIGYAVAGDEERPITLRAEQVFLFVNEIQNEEVVALIKKDPQRCEILPTGIEVLQLILDKSAMAPLVCPYPEPKYENCKNECRKKTNLRERFICFGACTASCLS
jgi:hypothetical protein